MVEIVTVDSNGQSQGDGDLGGCGVLSVEVSVGVVGEEWKSVSVIGGNFRGTLGREDAGSLGTLGSVTGGSK